MENIKKTLINDNFFIFIASEHNCGSNRTYGAVFKSSIDRAILRQSLMSTLDNNIIWGISGACLGHVWDNIGGILATMDMVMT